MDKFYQIAGLTVKMNTFGRTLEQLERYACESDGEADITVTPTYDKLIQRHPELADDRDLCEYLCTGANFYKQLLNFDGLMLHSSAVVVDGKAYLFTADSGTGKSSHANLWLQNLPESYILNDDKPALRLVDGIWYAFGTPWSGKNDISVNAGVPVAGIAVLERSQTNEIAPFSGIEAIHALLKQVNRPIMAQYRALLLELLDKLITQIPVWKLKCNMDRQAAIVSYEAMSGQRYRGDES